MPLNRLERLCRAGGSAGWGPIKKESAANREGSYPNEKMTRKPLGAVVRITDEESLELVGVGGTVPQKNARPSHFV